MLIDARTFIFLGANILLFYLSQLVNHGIVDAGIYLFLLGPMPVMPALYLRARTTFICMFLTGLWIDAACPVPFGFFTLLFVGTGTFISLMRHRLRAEHSQHPFILTHCFNLICIMLLSLTKGAGHYLVLELWIETALVVLASSLALWATTPWFFRLQRMLIAIFRLDPEPQGMPIR
ncbi:MAG: Uncharacterised protein [Opitutia bacterium UBA7350]|nr:MAG: Uncharacterised protein [Opitutae bacterium UBA7350]